VTEEFAEKYGRQTVRYVIVGTKSDSSERRVSLPTKLLADLPAKIEGPLFDGGAKAAGKRLMRFMRAVGITDPRKTTHCLRHRAKDRLRALSCPVDIQYAILGHEKKTVAALIWRGVPLWHAAKMGRSDRLVKEFPAEAGLCESENPPWPAQTVGPRSP
jgi:integrase